MKKKDKKLLIRIIIALIETIILYILTKVTSLNQIGKGWLLFALYLIPYFTVGYDVLRKAIKGLLHGEPFDECFLMGVATIGAFAVAISSSGDYLEAVAVMLFYQIGELFQSIAVGKSRKNISNLMDIRPDYANIEVNGVLEQVSPETLEVGTIIVCNPGEKIPMDGIVIEGSSTLNTMALTGESLPRDVKVDDSVLSGSINLSGVLKIKTTATFGESTASKILDLVENASSRKAKSENFISKFARIYTPVVCYSALALAILPPLFCMLILHQTSSWALWSSWIYRGLTFLVISCPCAIVVSVPLSFFGGLGGASSQGILIKGSNYMETLADVKIVVCDKTGTLTKGNFEVTDIHEAHMDSDKLLEYASLAEAHSSHPISKSLQRAYGKDLDLSRVSNVEEMSGHGVIATVDNKKVACGNHKLMVKLGIACQECESIGTVVYIAIDNIYQGHFVISDELKEHTQEAMSNLKSLGIKKTVMLTGDSQKVALHVAKECGISDVKAELLPGDKVDCVETLLKEKDSKEILAFVGDGINDAPVLSRADIGIAMGGLGSDAAIEAADVVLMDDDPLKISKAIKIAKKCLNIVRTNIIFAITVKVACLILGALGIANMWLAIFADVGVMVLCVLNAIRALMVKKL